MGSRKTGPDKRTVELVTARADGVCECCGAGAAEQCHHRQARGMGGSRDPAANATSNLFFICYDCHSSIESKRMQSMGNGWLVSKFEDPISKPILYRGTWVLLDDEGGLMCAE